LKKRTLTAITRAVSPSLADCELTFLARQKIDVARAIEQHLDYEECLARLGVRLVRLPAEPDLPDSVFVEDTAIVLANSQFIGGSICRYDDERCLRFSS
jgi:hypothetical protein